MDWLLNVAFPVFAPWFWRCWILAALLVEGVALANAAEGDTLSEQVWRWMALAKFIGWMVTAFLVWMTVHFATGGRWA